MSSAAVDSLLRTHGESPEARAHFSVPQPTPLPGRCTISSHVSGPDQRTAAMRSIEALYQLALLLRASTIGSSALMLTVNWGAMPRWASVMPCKNNPVPLSAPWRVAAEQVFNNRSV